MRQSASIVGQRFIKLVVLEEVGLSPRGHRLCYARCDCGRTVTVRAAALKAGGRKSCGCLLAPGGASRLAAAKKKTIHGESRAGKKTPEWNTWWGVIKRCEDPSHSSYDRYGGAGIKICPRWRASYLAFLEDMGRKPTPRHTIDRIDNEKGYEPSNCRWASYKEQRANQRPIKRK